MDNDQLMLGGVPEDNASVGSVESVHGGGEIPPVQGAGLPDAGLYMFEERVRRTMHAWRGAELPVQTVVTVQDVEALAWEADRALQATATQSAAGIAHLTHETGTTFGRVETAMQNMDSRVDSMDARLQQLRTEQDEQLQCTEATRQSTAELE